MYLETPSCCIGSAEGAPDTGIALEAVEGQIAVGEQRDPEVLRDVANSLAAGPPSEAGQRLLKAGPTAAADRQQGDSISCGGWQGKAATELLLPAGALGATNTSSLAGASGPTRPVSVVGTCSAPGQGDKLCRPRSDAPTAAPLIDGTHAPGADAATQTLQTAPVGQHAAADIGCIDAAANTEDEQDFAFGNAAAGVSLDVVDLLFRNWCGGSYTTNASERCKASGAEPATAAQCGAAGDVAPATFSFDTPAAVNVPAEGLSTTLWPGSNQPAGTGAAADIPACCQHEVAGSLPATDPPEVMGPAGSFSCGAVAAKPPADTAAKSFSFAQHVPAAATADAADTPSVFWATKEASQGGGNVCNGQLGPIVTANSSFTQTGHAAASAVTDSFLTLRPKPQAAQTRLAAALARIGPFVKPSEPGAAASACPPQGAASMQVPPAAIRKPLGGKLLAQAADPAAGTSSVQVIAPIIIPAAGTCDASDERQTPAPLRSGTAAGAFGSPIMCFDSTAAAALPQADATAVGTAATARATQATGFSEYATAAAPAGAASLQDLANERAAVPVSSASACAPAGYGSAATDTASGHFYRKAAAAAAAGAAVDGDWVGDETAVDNVIGAAAPEVPQSVIALRNSNPVFLEACLLAAVAVEMGEEAATPAGQDGQLAGDMPVGGPAVASNKEAVKGKRSAMRMAAATAVAAAFPDVKPKVAAVAAEPEPAHQHDTRFSRRKADKKRSAAAAALEGAAGQPSKRKQDANGAALTAADDNTVTDPADEPGAAQMAAAAAASGGDGGVRRSRLPGMKRSNKPSHSGKKTPVADETGAAALNSSASNIKRSATASELAAAAAAAPAAAAAAEVESADMAVPECCGNQSSEAAAAATGGDGGNDAALSETEEQQQVRRSGRRAAAALQAKLMKAGILNQQRATAKGRKAPTNPSFMPTTVESAGRKRGARASEAVAVDAPAVDAEDTETAAAAAVVAPAAKRARSGTAAAADDEASVEAVQQAAYLRRSSRVKAAAKKGTKKAVKGSNKVAPAAAETEDEAVVTAGNNQRRVRKYTAGKAAAAAVAAAAAAPQQVSDAAAPVTARGRHDKITSAAADEFAADRPATSTAVSRKRTAAAANVKQVGKLKELQHESVYEVYEHQEQQQQQQGEQPAAKRARQSAAATAGQGRSVKGAAKSSRGKKTAGAAATAAGKRTAAKSTRRTAQSRR